MRGKVLRLALSVSLVTVPVWLLRIVVGGYGKNHTNIIMSLFHPRHAKDRHRSSKATARPTLPARDLVVLIGAR